MPRRTRKARASSIFLPIVSGLGAATSEFGKFFPIETLDDDPPLELDVDEGIPQHAEISHSDSFMIDEEVADDFDEVADDQLHGDLDPPQPSMVPPSSGLQTVHENDAVEGETLIPCAELQTSRNTEDVTPGLANGQASTSNVDEQHYARDRDPAR
ncbi:hypothetical protein Dimus_027043 [Dionaea muscipula]